MRFLLCILFCFGPVYANAVNHWETVVYSSDIWSYQLGNPEITADWNTLYFNDNDWLQGKGGIGYGDNDDNTIINHTASLYLRTKFNIIDTSKIESAILHIDYDDGFVAYLNGTEIARAGLTATLPAYDETADDHEAVMYGGGTPSEFSIENELLKSILNQGENVLAIQVHNSTETSSDMSSNTFLSLGIIDTSHLYRETPDWFTAPFEFTSSNIPIVIIDTEGGTIVHEPKISAKMGIINNGAGNTNSVNDPFNDYDGIIGIEYRGNASFRHFDKKPYSIETRKADGSNNNVELFGLPKENDFVLRAAQMDKTLMRDALAYYLYRQMGHWAPRTRYVELVLNGEYQGVYVLEEKIKPDKKRLNIKKMDEEDISGDNLTGGYIWCTNRRWGDEEHNDLLFDTLEVDGNQRFLRYPKPKDVMQEQYEYIRNYEQEFCNIMYTPYYNDPEIGYNKYVNVESFIDEIIIQELTSNSDAYGYSGYFHKDRGGKIFAGPVWDFDQALCNSTHNDGARTDEWIVTKPSDSVPQFWKIFFDDADFNRQLKIKWNEYRSGVLSNNKIMAYIDSVANYLDVAKENNFSKWQILGAFTWRSLPGYEDRDTYQKEVDYMKEWLVAHLAWMDEQLYLDPSAVDGGSSQSISNFKLCQNYPNPFNPVTNIKYTIPTSGFVTVKVFNQLGQVVKTLVNQDKKAGEYSLEFNAENLSSGIYYYRLQTGEYSITKKMILLK